MINKVAIKWLYKHTKRPKAGFPEEVLAEVTKKCEHFFQVSFKDGFMTIGSLEDYSPFKHIRLTCIKGFEIVDPEVAVVTGTYIIFFNNKTGAIKINIKDESRPIWEKFTHIFHVCCREDKVSCP